MLVAFQRFHKADEYSHKISLHSKIFKHHTPDVGNLSNENDTSYEYEHVLRRCVPRGTQQLIPKMVGLRGTRATPWLSLWGHAHTTRRDVGTGWEGYPKNQTKETKSADICMSQGG